MTIQVMMATRPLTRTKWRVTRLLHDLIANTQVQYNHGDATPQRLDELAVRFHYELVRIRLWPNGNGRHSRLATDLLLGNWGRPPFTWGSATHPTKHHELRDRYIGALKFADAGMFEELTRFVRE